MISKSLFPLNATLSWSVNRDLYCNYIKKTLFIFPPSRQHQARTKIIHLQRFSIIQGIMKIKHFRLQKKNEDRYILIVILKKVNIKEACMMIPIWVLCSRILLKDGLLKSLLTVKQGEISEREKRKEATWTSFHFLYLSLFSPGYPNCYDPALIPFVIGIIVIY